MHARRQVHDAVTAIDNGSHLYLFYASIITSSMIVVSSYCGLTPQFYLYQSLVGGASLAAPSWLPWLTSCSCKAVIPSTATMPRSVRSEESCWCYHRGQRPHCWCCPPHQSIVGPPWSSLCLLWCFSCSPRAWGWCGIERGGSWGSPRRWEPHRR